MKDLQYFDQLQDVMHRSGKLVMQHFGKNFEIFQKNGNSSIVTAVDLENERFLKEELSKIIPDAGFCAEESIVCDQQSDFIWVIDPLDGTRNFAKGIPHFCIMIALTYKNEPVVGALYQPVTQQFYYAQSNQGLWCNGLKVTQAERSVDKAGAIVVCDQADLKSIKLKLKENKIQVSRRYFGCAGIDALYVALGNIDLVVFTNIAWWDVAVGILFIQEAGGLVCNYKKSSIKDGFVSLKAGSKLFFDDF